MNWKSILDELPINGSLVYAKIGSKELLCNYKDDSFGLGDYDFQITKWRYAVCAPTFGLKSPYYNPQSNAQAGGHEFEDSLELIESLAP